EFGETAEQYMLVGAYRAQDRQLDQEPAELRALVVHVHQQQRIAAEGQVPAPAAVGARGRQRVARHQGFQGQPALRFVRAARLAQRGGGGIGVGQRAGGAEQQHPLAQVGGAAAEEGGRRDGAGG